MENLRGSDRDGKAGSVHAAGTAQRHGVGDLVALSIRVEALLCARRSITKGSKDHASAASRTIAGEDGDSNHDADEEDIKHDAEEREKRLAAEEARQQNGEDGVEHSSARHARDGFHPCCDDEVAVGKDGEKVAVDTEDDGCTAKLNGIENGLE